MDMRKAFAAGLTGILLTGGIGAAVAENHDMEVPEELPEVPEIPEDLPQVPEIPEELPEVPEELPEVPEIPEDLPQVPEIPEELPEVPEELPEIPEELPEVPEIPAELPEVPQETDDGRRGPHQDNFGARVSADARGESDGVRGVDGQQISSEARAKRTTR